MKRRRDRILFFIAALLSLGSHGVLVWLIMSLPIGGDGPRLFADAPRERLEIVPIDRAPDDLIVEEHGVGSATIAPATLPGATLPGAAEGMLGALDPAKLSGAEMAKVPGFNAPPAGAGAPADPTVTHAVPSVAAPQAPPGRVLDATARLLAAASPSVSLPAFVSETDVVVAETPMIDRGNPAARIDPRALKNIDTMLAPPGSGSGAGVAGGPAGAGGGTAVGSLVSLPPAPPPLPPVAAVTPRVEMPRVPPKLPDPPPTVTRPAPGTPGIPGTPGSEPPAIHLDEDFDYHLRVLPELPADPGFFGLGGDKPVREPGWFEVRISPKRSLRRLKPLHKDVVYVLDTSESVSAAWIEQMKRGVLDGLDSLNEGDRFNLVLFKETVSVMSPDALLEATGANKAAAVRFMTGAESSGWTDLNRALGRLIVRQTPPDRVYQIVLLSDGLPTRGEVDAREIINLITRENDGVASIFAVAVGDRTNTTLLEFLTYRNKGFVVYPKGAAQGGTAVRDLAGRLRYPVVKDAMFTAVGVDTSTIYPRIPRDMYQGENVLLYGRYAPGASQRLSMRLVGTNDKDTLDLTFTLDFRGAEAGDKSLAASWGFWKLHHLYSEIIRTGQTPAVKQQIDELRTKYKLKTTY